MKKNILLFLSFLCLSAFLFINFNFKEGVKENRVESKANYKGLYKKGNFYYLDPLNLTKSELFTLFRVKPFVDLKSKVNKKLTSNQVKVAMSMFNLDIDYPKHFELLNSIKNKFNQKNFRLKGQPLNWSLKAQSHFVNSIFNRMMEADDSRQNLLYNNGLEVCTQCLKHFIPSSCSKKSKWIYEKKLLWRKCNTLPSMKENQIKQSTFDSSVPIRLNWCKVYKICCG